MYYAMLQTSIIIICYLVGILIGKLPWISLNREILEYSSMTSVILAIPLLLSLIGYAIGNFLLV
jgi:hypothetical protein